MPTFTSGSEGTSETPDLLLKVTGQDSVTPAPAVVRGSQDDDLVTNEFRVVFQVVNFVVICQAIDLFGTGTNIVNIICFVKQGLKDSVNISLLALTISDLLSLVTLIWHNISVNPWLYESDIPFDSVDTVYLFAGFPHIGMTRVTGWITAFITLERCLCVVFPLKVKTIITPNRVKIVIVSIFIIIFTGSVAPTYYCNYLVTKKSLFRNKTWLGVYSAKDRRIVERYAFAVNCFLPFAAFVVISVSTIVLVVKLKSKTKWRQRSMAPGQSDSLSRRDQSVSKMIIMISTVFIICYTPVCVMFIAMIIVPQLSMYGRYVNVFGIVFSFAYILEAINASFNIFIYYKVSSRYREVYRQIFPSGKDQKKLRINNNSK